MQVSFLRLFSRAVNTLGNNWCGMLFACLRTGGCVVGLTFPIESGGVIFLTPYTYIGVFC